MLFQLDPRLQSDCVVIGDLPLSRLLLMNDKQYPWMILVPRKNQVHEIYELDTSQQQQLWIEIAEVSKVLKQLFAPHKLNIGALGNIVRQLHIHVIARFEHDIAWPGPVWGAHPPKAYSEPELSSTKQRLFEAMQQVLKLSPVT
jgi:diadenosine tetraphosphate (Ap4A) HIT family hydrolase